MRERLLVGCVLSAIEKIVRELTRRAAGSISDADKIRCVRFQIANRPVERLGRFRRFRGKKFKRKRRTLPSHNVSDMHDSAASIVSVATFRQTMKPFSA